MWRSKLSVKSARDVVRWATRLATGCALAGLASGCGASEVARSPDQTPSQLTSELGAAPCTGYEVVSLESPKSGCADIGTDTGRWVGASILRLREGVYCSYHWVGRSTGSGSGATQIRTAPLPTRGAAAPQTGGGTATAATPQPPYQSKLASNATQTQMAQAPTMQGQSNEPHGDRPPAHYPPDHKALRGLKQAAIDCPVVAMSAVGPGDTLWPKTLRDTYRAQAGWIKKLPIPEGKVRAAVIDTAVSPFGSSQSDTYGHGRAVGRVISDIACPYDGGSGCAVEVENDLALPLRTPDWADYNNGGFYGTRGQLAAALVKAIDSWREAVLRKGDRRLLLTMSLAWDPKHGGEFEKDYRQLDLPSQVVYMVLNYASCMGALPIAAQGNRSGPSDSGPMYPAAWEAVAAPTPSACAAYGWGKAPGSLPAYELEKRAAKYRPLVYGVGAVDATDVPLANTRPGAQARRVAYGLTVVTDDPQRKNAEGQHWTMVLTGTSMANAVVGGVIAAAWGYLPQLTAHQIMELVQETAVPVIGPGSVDVCYQAAGACNSYSIDRVSACDAVSKALALSGTKAQLPCKTVPKGAGKSVPAGNPDTTAYASIAAPSGPCTPPGCGVPPGTVPKGEKPWVGPQPGDPSCASCFVWRGSEHLFVYLQSGVANTLKGIVLNAGGSGTSIVYDVTRPDPAGYPQSFMTHVSGVGSVTRATLTSVFSAGPTTVSIEEPIPVY